MSIDFHPIQQIVLLGMSYERADYVLPFLAFYFILWIKGVEKKHVIMSVGTIGGDVYLWDLGARQRITEKGFDVWKLDACSKELQVCLSPF